MVTVFEATLTNKRIDDLAGRMVSEFADLKNLMLIQIQTCDECRKNLNNRITILEHFKTRILTISSGIGLVVGLIVGKILI